MALTLRSFTKQDFEAHESDFLAIAADIEDENWTAENFLVDLPGKWELSVTAWSDGRPVAYAVVSRKADDTAHLHHFMVTNAFRGQGLGQRLLVEAERRAEASGCARMTLKVATGNAGARRFYTVLGYAAGEKAGGYVTMVKGI